MSRLLWTLTTALLAPPLPPPFPPGEDASEGDPLKRSGREVYQADCAVCHGKKGEGTPRGLPLHVPYRAYASFVTRQGRSASPTFPIPMPAYSESMLSQQQLAEIWEYLDAQFKPQTGAELYLAYCGNCHGQEAEGGVSGHALNEQTEALALWVRWGANEGLYASRFTYMPRWNKWEITDEELEKIRVYVQTPRSQRHRPVVDINFSAYL